MATERGSQVVALLNEWNADLAPQDRQAKFEKMAATPFVFYRGTNRLFWQDFSADDRLINGGDFGNDKTRTWLAGDAHIANLGAFADSRGKVVYGLNDFDEAIIRDYRYDLWRMAISIALAARELGMIRHERGLTNAFAAGYLDALAAPLRERGFGRRAAEGELRPFLGSVEDSMSRSRQLRKWTRKARGHREFDSELPKLRQATDQAKDAIDQAMPSYWSESMFGRAKSDIADFTIIDIAVRLDAGTGSLGAPRFYLLLQDRSGSKTKLRILDVKAQTRPAAVQVQSTSAQADYELTITSEGRRHAMAYHAMTTDPDRFLGWLELPDGSYSVRERSPYKKTFPIEKVKWRRDLRVLCTQWGKVLATQHRRGDRNIEVALEQHLGRQLRPRERELVALNEDIDHALLNLVWGRESAFLDEVSSVAAEYADQVELDATAFRDSL